MRKIFNLLLFLFVSACGVGCSDAIEEKSIKAATGATTEAATAAVNQLAADVLCRAEAEKLIRFGTGKFGQSTFQ